MGPTQTFCRGFPSTHWEEEEGNSPLNLTRAADVGSSGAKGRPGTCFHEASSQAGETLTKEVEMQIGQLQLTGTAEEGLAR